MLQGCRWDLTCEPFRQRQGCRLQRNIAKLRPKHSLALVKPRHDMSATSACQYPHHLTLTCQLLLEARLLLRQDAEACRELCLLLRELVVLVLLGNELRLQCDPLALQLLALDVLLVELALQVVDRGFQRPCATSSTVVAVAVRTTALARCMLAVQQHMYSNIVITYPEMSSLNPAGCL